MDDCIAFLIVLTEGSAVQGSDIESLCIIIHTS
jgi:hypothetical protein